MGDHSTFNLHHGGPRGNFAGFYDLDDSFRLQTTKLPIALASKTESTRWLRLHYRYCNNERFASMVEKWKEFEIPDWPFQVKLDAHSGPPIETGAQLRHLSVNRIKAWIYRGLTWKRYCIRPNTPICISNPSALLRFVEEWDLDGKQMLHVNAREKLHDPVNEDETVTCVYVRQILCDIVWLQLCRAVNHECGRIGVERATRHLQAHVDEYLRYSEVDSGTNSMVGSRRGPRGHRRNLTDTRFDRAMMRQSTIKEEYKRLSLGTRVTVTDLENSNPTTLNQPDARGKDQKSRWRWSNPLRQKTVAKRKSSEQREPSPEPKEPVETDHSHPLSPTPTNDMQCKCMTTNDRRGRSAQKAEHPTATDVFEDQTALHSSVSSIHGHETADLISRTALRSQRASLENHQRPSTPEIESNDDDPRDHSSGSNEQQDPAEDPYGWLEIDEDSDS